MSASLRMTPSRELEGSLSVTVETAQILRVRRAIIQSGRRPIGIVRATPLAGGTRVRMLIALPHESIARVSEAIERAIVSARIVHVLIATASVAMAADLARRPALRARIAVPFVSRTGCGRSHGVISRPGGARVTHLPERDRRRAARQ